jgi:predicted RNA-binding Zn-ribbon protein involved in translation (DUF1610 family)
MPTVGRGRSAGPPSLPGRGAKPVARLRSGLGAPPGLCPLSGAACFLNLPVQLVTRPSAPARAARFPGPSPSISAEEGGAPFTLHPTRNLYRLAWHYGDWPRVPVERAQGGAVRKARSSSTGAFPVLRGWNAPAPPSTSPRSRRPPGGPRTPNVDSGAAISSSAKFDDGSPMSPLWGPSRRDEVHLLSALESLGSTSLAGLSAALSWSERKTERCIREVVTSGAAPLRYDAAGRTVEWVTRSSAVAAAVTGAPTRTPSYAPPRLPTAALRASAPAPSVAPPASSPSPSSAFPARCPTCHANLTPTGSGGHGYCTKCGRLVPLSATSPAKAAGPSPATSGPSTTAGSPTSPGDRKSQEMFAAWVASRPVPCPRCRTPMGHHGLAEYGCPSCGEKVSFPRPELPTAPLRPPAGAPPAAAPST